MTIIEIDKILEITDTILETNVAGVITLRHPLNKDNEWQTWFGRFSVICNTSWKVHQTYPYAQKYQFRKRYICYRNKSRNLPNQPNINTDCPADDWGATGWSAPLGSCLALSAHLSDRRAGTAPPR